MTSAPNVYIRAAIEFPERDEARALLREYSQHTEREDGSSAGVYVAVSCVGTRWYVADDFDHVREQHEEAFPEEGELLLIAELLVRA